MRRGTTPTLRIRVKGIGVDKLNSIYLTIKQDKTELTKERADVTIDTVENRLIVPLTQAETLLFTDGICQIQLRATTTFGTAIASGVVSSTWEHILKEGVIE